MAGRTAIITLLMLMCCRLGFALEPDEIFVISNRQIPLSKQIAEYYCEKRNVPKKNIIYLALGNKPRGTINRDEYEHSLALPIRRQLQQRFPGEIRCLVTTYGIPTTVGRRGPLPGTEGKLKELKRLLSEEKQRLKESRQTKQIKNKISQMQLEIGRINGKETNASVDSELS
ncbi:MAG: hypothetical protein ACYSR9_14315, partial [Planctomycetota bacterium]